MQKKLLILLIIVIALGALGWWQCVLMQKEVLILRQANIGLTLNQKVLAFTSLFIDQVLRAEGEVDFETRLKLENSIRAIGDQELLTQWRRFVESADEAAAQVEVKALLALLVDKLSVE